MEAEVSPVAVSAEAAAMHGDVLGILLSFLLVGFFMGISFLVVRFGKKRLGEECSEVARKIVHIGVSNWFFIYYYVFESDIWPIAGLACFAVLNAVMNVSGGLKTVMGQDSKKRNWGLVYYPVSIIILIALKSFGVCDIVSVGCGVLGMGYGDGLASLVGKRGKSAKVVKKGSKTWAGSITVAVVTFTVVLLLKLGYTDASAARITLSAAAAALAASAVEVWTPYGLDNISVPVTIFLITGLI